MKEYHIQCQRIKLGNLRDATSTVHKTRLYGLVGCVTSAGKKHPQFEMTLRPSTNVNYSTNSTIKLVYSFKLHKVGHKM